MIMITTPTVLRIEKILETFSVDSAINLFLLHRVIIAIAIQTYDAKNPAPLPQGMRFSSGRYTKQ